VVEPGLFRQQETVSSSFLLSSVSSDPRLAIFEKSKFFWEWGLTKGKSVVYLCPIAPADGDVGRCGAEKILKKMDF